jgi:very-short-patch-repair endonuclease
MKEWKDNMAGQNEDGAIKIFDLLGYSLGSDYVRQYPIGERFVLDFAFVNEQVAIEIDGDSHRTKKQKAIDAKRDKYLSRNGWVPLRIYDKDLNGYKGSFFKNLIREIVEERRKQYDIGKLYAIDIPNYVDEDY